MRKMWRVDDTLGEPDNHCPATTTMAETDMYRVLIRQRDQVKIRKVLRPAPNVSQCYKVCRNASGGETPESHQKIRS